MKFLLAALLVCLATVAQSATYYGFKIGGISVTSDNFNNVRSDHMSALKQSRYEDRSALQCEYRAHGKRQPCHSQ